MRQNVSHRQSIVSRASLQLQSLQTVVEWAKQRTGMSGRRNRILNVAQKVHESFYVRSYGVAPSVSIVPKRSFLALLFANQTIHHARKGQYVSFALKHSPY